VMFLSSNAYARRFETDSLRELRADGVAARIVALTAGDSQSLAHPNDVVVVRARPDAPNANGAVNCVLQGASIYPWSPVR
jgi:hypothetical protein